MIEDRSLQRPRDRHRESWNDLTSGASSSSAQVDRNALIVYQDADEQSGEPIVSQLLMKARITLPAVMNYLFFGSTQTAVVYFGKRVDEDGTKIGCINEGAEDFKVRMIRYLTSEMWPPLLRTDAPDESLGADLLTRSMLLADWQGPETLISGDSTVFADNEREKMQERFWLRRSLESNMQVLLYLKNGTVGGKYLKVILGNPSQRLHFDVIDIREEKYRWDLRMLFTRIMDNLETQKAIASYDSFLHLFREACAMADAHAMALERTSQQVPLLVWNELPEDSVDDFESLLRPTAPPVLDLFDEEDPATPPRTSGEDRSPENSTTQAPPSMEALSPLATRRPTGLKIAIASPSSPVLMDSERLPSFTPRVSSIMSMHSPGTELTPTHSTNRFYRWMERLEKPESATLDYKSYFSYPADEIKHRCVKFMCGFLNAYGEGKLVVGVHEIAHRDPDGNLVSEKEGRNNIVQHNDLVDQYVVGLRVSMEDLEEVQADVSKQLQRCLPPIPPQTVQLDVVPVQFPQNFTISRKILILYEQGSMYSISRDSLKQKSNYAIRFLYPLDLTIVPLGLVDSQLLRLVMDNVPPGTDLVPEYLKAEAYAIAAIHNPASLDNPNWETDLSSNLCGRTRCRHLFVDYGNGATELDFKLRVPQLHVVEVSVNIKRCGYAPLMDYKGKFFAGWPSIPMWDATTQSARRVERNYRLMISQDGDGSPSSSPQRAAGAGATSPASAAAASASDGTVAMSSPRPKAKAKLGWRWFTDLKVVSRVLSYLYDHHNIEDTLAFRLIHPQCNKIFENRQGLHLVEMIQSTPVGVPVMSVSHDHISRMQGAFLSSGIPPLPLLLCRIYELIGNLPSPYPYVAVPLMQQTFRVAPVLIPLFYRQHYFDGQLRMAVVLDLRDGVMKTLELRDGNLILDAIVGMGFDRMNKRQVVQQLSQQACINPKKWMDLDLCSLTPSSFHLHPKRNYLARSLMGMRRSRSHNSSAVMSPLTSDQTRSFPREVEPDLPLLHFRFLTRQMLETQANNSNTTNFLDGAAVPQPSPCAHVPTNQRRVRSWTLQHLLMWNSSLLTDTAHVGFFGYCERSVAFRIARLKEICADDLEPSVLDGLASAQMEQLSLSSCAHECLIHQKVKEWMKV